MSDANGASALPEGTLTEGAEGTTGKGKGKAVDQAPVHDASMDEDDDSEEDEEEQACKPIFIVHREQAVASRNRSCTVANTLCYRHKKNPKRKTKTTWKR